MAPDVGEDDLLVQGGPDEAQPVAFAGISFALEDGEQPESVGLSVRQGSATTPGAELALCRLVGSATPAAGDPSDGAPPVDCTARTTAGPSADGTRYDFDVSAFAAAGSLDLAIVPTRQTDRVVIARPSAADLQSTSTQSSEPGGSSGGVGGGDEPVGPFDGTGSSSSEAAAGGFTPGDPTISLPPMPMPARPPGASAKPASEAEGSPAPGDAGSAPLVEEHVSAERPGHQATSSPSVLVFVALAATAAALWGLAGREPALDADGVQRPPARFVRS